MEQIKLDIVPVGVAPVAHASQFDNGRQIRFNLFNQGTPYTLTGAETVTMVVNGEEENITNTSDNYVIWDVAEEDCAEAGVIGCEIRIVLGSMLIGSKNFFLEVEMDPYNGKNIRTVTVGPADICTFETTLPEPLQSVIVDVVASGGNGTPDNPNPIVGYTEANITRCGVNLWDFTDTTASSSVSNYYLNFPSKTYTLSFELENATYQNGGAALFDFYNEDGTNFAYPTPNLLKRASDNATMSSLTQPLNDRFYFTFTNSLSRIRLNFVTSGYGQWTGKIKNVTLTEGTDTTYHAYNGQTYAIAFGQTVYGGVLDVTRGKLTVTHLYKVYDGSEAWYTSGASGGEYRVSLAETLTNVKLPTDADTVLDCLCNMFTGKTANQTYQRTEGISWQSGNGIRIYASNYNTSDITPWKTLLTNTPLQVVYELATPIDIDLTPVVISAIVGENNVFADCGQTTVKYLAEG